MSIEELIFPLIGILVVFIIAILIIITGHRQHMLMIAKGINPKFKRASSGLKGGLILTFSGIAFLAIFSGKGEIYPGISWYTPGSILLALGLANLVYYLVRGRHETKQLKYNTSSTKLNKNM